MPASPSLSKLVDTAKSIANQAAAEPQVGLFDQVQRFLPTIARPPTAPRPSRHHFPSPAQPAISSALYNGTAGRCEPQRRAGITPSAPLLARLTRFRAAVSDKRQPLRQSSRARHPKLFGPGGAGVCRSGHPGFASSFPGRADVFSVNGKDDHNQGSCPFRLVGALCPLGKALRANVVTDGNRQFRPSTSADPAVTNFGSRDRWRTSTDRHSDLQRGGPSVRHGDQLRYRCCDPWAGTASAITAGVFGPSRARRVPIFFAHRQGRQALKALKPQRLPLVPVKNHAHGGACNQRHQPSPIWSMTVSTFERQTARPSTFRNAKRCGTGRRFPTGFGHQQHQPADGCARQLDRLSFQGRYESPTSSPPSNIATGTKTVSIVGRCGHRSAKRKPVRRLRRSPRMAR